MDGYDPMLSFGEEVAGIYDQAPRGDEADAVGFLAQLAGDGRALELAIGTGRIALPLAAMGVPVDGIDLSEPMVSRLRGKPGGDALDVTIGNFADVPVSGSYRLIYIVFNTLFNLLTQDEQVRCIVNVAAHLDDDGVFVVEAAVPSYLHRWRDHQSVDAEAVEIDRVTLDVSRHDPVRQLQEESHVTITRNGIQLHPIVTRYIWPAELDLMARIAGLRPAGRYGGWRQEPFTRDSALHVSVYRR